MKWIGQGVYDFISRFRNDVYLESISTGTIASGGNLGLDSNNKIVKATETSGDITAVTITTDSGGGSAASDTGGSADFSILGTSGVGVTNSGTTITATSVPGEIDHDSLLNFVAAEHYDWSSDIGSTAKIHTNNIGDLHGAGVDGADNQLLTDNGGGAIVSEANLTYDGTDLTAVSSSEGKPVLTLKTTHTTKTSSAELQFLKDAADTEDGENLGLITFYGENENNQNTKFAQIKGSIAESDASAEGGSIKLAVATHDGEIQNGLIIQDGDAEDEIDVTIGNTATSLTTITGTLTMGSTAFVNNSGVVQVATQGTIDHDSLANFVAAEHVNWASDSAGTIHSTNIPTLNQNTTGSAATLTTTRAFQTDLASTSSANFNGSAANTHGVTGTLALGNGGTGNTTGVQSGKNYRIVNCNFRADIGTTKYYLPLKSQDEQTALTREEMQEVAVCDGRLVSVTYRGEAFNTHSGDATVTFGVETNTVGTSYSSGYSVQETEDVTVNNADDQHIFHAVFDSAKHWDSTDMFAISIQSDTDITGSNERIFLTLVIEDDWSTYLAGSTREIDSTP